MGRIRKMQEMGMRKWLGVVVTGSLLGSTVWAAAQGNSSGTPLLRITCNVPQAAISIEPAESGGGERLTMDDTPAALKPGVQYTLMVTASGYETYRRTFAAEWKGLREKKIILQKARSNELKRDFGPMDGDVWIADLEDGVRIEFMPIPAGSFMMGSDSGEEDERPVHEVQFRRSFWMARTEVTNQQFEQYKKSPNTVVKEFTLEENEVPMPQGAVYPVCNVSWQDAMNFCKWLTKKERRRGRLPEGFEYTLPTEAEWEYACRAGTTESFAGKLEAMAWFKGNSSERTSPVGTKNPNEWGLHDMHGNVWEWCADYWYASYRNAPENGSQRGDAYDEYDVDLSRIDDAENVQRLYSPAHRVVRGGCWSYSAMACRSSNRFYHTPDYKLNYLGFRPVIVWNSLELQLKTTARLKDELE